MKILVTGGAGFIGSHLVDAYLEEGHDVVVLDNLRTGVIENLSPDARLIVGDINDAEALSKAMHGVEVTFHLAAISSVQNSVDDPLATHHANSTGTLNVLMAAHHAEVKRVVIASSSSVYGDTSQLPTPESVPTSPQSPYAASKVSAEDHARIFSSLRGLETVVLRYFNVFGPRQQVNGPYSAVIPKFISGLLAGTPIAIYGDGQQSRDFVYIDDVVKANRLAATTTSLPQDGGIYNVGCGEQQSVNEIAELLGHIIGVQPDIRYLPSRPADVVASCADITLASKDLGYSPFVSLEEGLKKTVMGLRRA